MGPYLSSTVVFVITMPQYIWRCLPKINRGYSLTDTGSVMSKCTPVTYIWGHQLYYYVEVLCYEYEGFYILRILINHMHKRLLCGRQGAVSISDKTSYCKISQISKSRHLHLKLCDRSVIWQAPRQHIETFFVEGHGIVALTSFCIDKCSICLNGIYMN